MSEKSTTKLQAEFDWAKISERARELEKGKVKTPELTRTIKRHKHVPVLAPSAQFRRAPDAKAFLYYEALDRKEAIKRRKGKSQDKQLSQQFKDNGRER